MLALQRLVGNGLLSRVVMAGRGTAAPAKRKAASTTADSYAAFVAGQVARGRFVEPAGTLPPGVLGPPTPGGAFWLLNGLSPTDLYETLRACGAPVRAALLAHVHESAGSYNRPRLESALRSAAWNERAGGVTGLTVLDALNTAGTATAAVWSLLAGKSRAAVLGALRTLPRPALTRLQAGLADAPPAGRAVLAEILVDLLGTGTDMSAGDVVDLAGLSGLQRRMASIYNVRGQLIQEQAADLGIGTSAAAGIMLAESGGRTFDDATDRALVRFENHVLWDRWGAQAGNRASFHDHFRFNTTSRWTGHFWREQASGDWEANHRDQAQEWRVQEFAARLAGEIAYECASFGAGQIMGFNHARVGFASAKEMADAYNRSERTQITGIFEFIRANRLAVSIRAGDFLTLAKKYNGKGKAAEYEAVIRSAATAYATVPPERGTSSPDTGTGVFVVLTLCPWTGGVSAGSASLGAAACAPGASSAARVGEGASVKEPELYPKNEANAYGVIKDAPRLPNGGVTTNSDWYTVVPGKNERDMKQALYTGDARTLNVYAANIGGGLLGRAIPSPMRWATG